MFLKRLVLSGFKSFADRTEFEFDRGITCIVGPNGCGKSNLVDAVRWVLGEQSARSLRGRQMLDVIFAGSATRRSAGLAQVDLVFDNSDHFLPTDQTELTVSRRLYRSGQSEYLLNKQPCRLRDIRELFLDTGVGVDAYSVIEQGRVDVLLQANPIERRAIFEEAAGISKYKLRKTEAVRKLERVGQNLLRLDDVIQEVERQLRSIKYQAGKAQSYQRYWQRLCELRAAHALAEFHKLLTAEEALQQQLRGASDQVAALRSQIEHLETRSSHLTANANQLDQQASQAEDHLLALQSQITTYQERAEQQRHRLAEHQQAASKARHRCWSCSQQVRHLHARVADQQRQCQQLDQELAQQRQQISQLADRDEHLGAQLAAAQARLEDEKASLIDLLRRISQLGNQIQALDMQRSSLAGQMDRLHARQAQITDQCQTTLAEKAQLQARRDQIEELIAARTAQLDQKTAQSAAVAEARKRLEADLAAAKERRSALESRQHLLAELIRNREGVAEGARQVLRQRDADPAGRRFGFVRGLVADLFEADSSHAAIIEAALHPFDQYLVVDDAAALFEQIEQFAGLGGRVEAFCLDRLGPLVDGRDFSQQDGFVAHALQWVRYPADCEHLARHLLGKTVIVDSLAHARRLAELIPSGYRFVTLAGQILEPDGRISLGPLASQVGLITRRSELRELGRDLAELQQQITRLSEHRDELARQAEQLAQAQQELRTAIYQAQAARAEIDASLRSNAEAARRLSHEQPLITAELEALQQQITEAQQRQEDCRHDLQQLESQHNQRQEQIERLGRQIERLAAERRHLQEQLTQARVLAGQLGQKRTALAEALETTGSALAEAHHAAAETAAELAEATQRIAQAERTILSAQSNLAQLFLKKESQQRQMSDLRRQRELARLELQEIAERARSARSQLAEEEQVLHHRQLQLQEARVRRDNLAQRIADELQIDLAEQHANYEPVQQDWAAVEAEIVELRAKIDRLGNVNLDAIEQQEQLQQRHDFLTGQRDDLLASRDQLEQLIARLNSESRQRFLTSFEQIRTHFQELFRKLFGGGRADIILENPDDVLESGIEIVARPPGKELQSISLLSGGEKTLAAVALLLGIFRSRPSPFAILDEVDAALDEANTDRFNRVLREFLVSTQFIVITHTKRTMTVADVLYGLTMQEAGVSQPVSVRFEDQTARPAAVA